jgi:hypothetical protein
MHHSGVQHALRLGVVLAFVALAVGACGTPEEAKPRTLPEERRELSPGAYRTDEFEPPFSFSVDEGWTNEPPEMSDALLLTRGHERWLGFANVREVFIYKPTKISSPNVVEAPEDMVGWFMRHPYLHTSQPEHWAAVGGVEGKRFDVSVGKLPQDYFGECGSSCVDLFRIGGAYPVFLREEDSARLIVLEDVEGETVIVGFFSPAAEFDGHAPEAQKVLDTVRWRGG